MESIAGQERAKAGGLCVEGPVLVVVVDIKATTTPVAVVRRRYRHAEEDGAGKERD